MNSRATLALLALAVARVGAQPTSILVDVNASPSEEFEDSEEVERRYTPELIEELESAKADALLLYTEFSARASQSLKQFIRNISSLEDETRRALDPGLLSTAPSHCRVQFEVHLKKAKNDAHRTAVFSGENHHKFFLGHMIVFRMHLNKSEEYVKRSEQVISTCGISCETQPRVKRWRRMALDELSRVRTDLQHSRLMYRDLLTHAHRRLKTERKRAQKRASDARALLIDCASNG